MKVLKSIALGLVATAASLLPLSANAQTRVTACHMGHAHTTLDAFPCNVTRRVNQNGHVVWDVRDRRNNNVTTAILWTDRTSELIYNGSVYTGKYYSYGNSQTRIILDHNEWNIIF